MNRKEKYKDTETFHFYNANPKGCLTTGDCSYRAVSAAAGIPWEDAVIELAKSAVKTSHAPDDKRTYGKYLTEHGFRAMRQPKHVDGTKYTGKEFCETVQEGIRRGYEHYNGLDVGRNIVADIGGHHVVAIIDGKVFDTWNSTGGCIGNYWVK